VTGVNSAVATADGAVVVRGSASDESMMQALAKHGIGVLPPQGQEGNKAAWMPPLPAGGGGGDEQRVVLKIEGMIW